MGIDAVLKLLYICIATTAPTNREVNNTKPKESTPKSLISLMKSFEKTLDFCGFLNTFPKRSTYSPKLLNILNMMQK